MDQSSFILINSLAALVLLVLVWRHVYIPGFFAPAVKILFCVAILGLLASLLKPTLYFQLPWLLLLGLVLPGLSILRFLRHGPFLPEEVILDLALLQGSGASLWVGAAWGQGSWLGFREPWLTLTAAHFLFIPMIMLMLCGVACRLAFGRKWLFRALFALAGSILIAFYIVALGLNGCSWAQLIGPPLLVASVIGFWSLFLVSSFQLLPKGARVLMGLAGACLLVTMSLALNYAYQWWPSSIPAMLHLHGYGNAFVIVPLFVCGFGLAVLPSRERLGRLPLSGIIGSGKISPDFFQRNSLLKNPTSEGPDGLIDSLDTFGCHDFTPAEVDSEIRAFYEKTREFKLDVQAQAMGLVGFLWDRIIRRLFQAVDQLNLPDGSELIQSQLVWLDEAMDQRQAPRGWIRSDRRTGRAIYVAAYSTHADAQRHYMNIAFPLPGCSLNSILAVRNFAPNGLELYTMASWSSADQGVYLQVLSRAIRLPMNETISVWKERGKLIAIHRIWFFGLHFLRLTYTMTRKGLDDE